jgi:hypothetical protein
MEEERGIVLGILYKNGPPGCKKHGLARSCLARSFGPLRVPLGGNVVSARHTRRSIGDKFGGAAPGRLSARAKRVRLAARE